MCTKLQREREKEVKMVAVEEALNSFLIEDYVFFPDDVLYGI